MPLDHKCLQPETVLLFYLFAKNHLHQQLFIAETFSGKTFTRFAPETFLHQQQTLCQAAKKQQKGFYTTKFVQQKHLSNTFYTEPILHKKHQKTLYAKNRFAGRLLTSHFSPEYTTPETWRNSTTSELLHHGQDGRCGVRVPDSFKEPFPKLSGEKKNTPKKARPKSWKIGWTAVLRTLAMCCWSVNEPLVGGFNPIRKILVKLGIFPK